MKAFLDSGVLLTAWRSQNPQAAATARWLLQHEGHKFLTCDNVLLELLPKPIYENRRAEVDFYQVHFNSMVSEPFSAEVGKAALTLAKKYGLAAGDALNMASAIRQGADEFFTSELPGKPMFCVKELRAISTHGLKAG